MRNFCLGNVGRLRGLTIVEVVVAVVVLAFLLLGLLIPMLARTRCVCVTDTCGSNMWGMGKAMLLYANDNNGKFPRTAGRGSQWGPTLWNATTRMAAYRGMKADGTGGNATIGSCFYLLVKYAEVRPKAFLCKGDRGVTEFSLAKEASDADRVTELTAAWDFGASPSKHYSYTYHAPWGEHALTTAGDPGFAVAADRNPWLAAPELKAKPFPKSADGKRRFQGKAGSSVDQLYGNSIVHGEDGQNVLYLDTHVTFEKRASCGLDDDNIYTVSAVSDKGDPLGIAPTLTVAGATPQNPRDSVLVHDPPTWSAPGR